MLLKNGTYNRSLRDGGVQTPEIRRKKKVCGFDNSAPIAFT
jgi:hypothetical protein